MNTLGTTSVHAFAEGRRARLAGQQLGMNPYDPGAEPTEYESWEDGWASVEETK